MVLFLPSIVAVLSSTAAAYTTATWMAGLEDDDHQAIDRSGRPPSCTSPDLATIAKWWIAHHDAIVENVKQHRPVFPHEAKTPVASARDAEVSRFEWASPVQVGTCEEATEDSSLSLCPANALETFATNVGVANMAIDEQLTSLMQTGVLIDRNDPTFPCKLAPTEESVPGRYRVIIDANYVNKPRCCAAGDFDAGKVVSDDASAPFKRAEEKLRNHADETDDAIQRQVDKGITFNTYDGTVYSTLIPQADKCSDDSKCSLVVEVPGASDVPWLLLQRLCDTCGQHLGVYLLSVDATEDTSASFVNNIFVPLVNQFIIDHSYVAKSRVYLVATSRGCEIALVAALTQPALFSVAYLAGKFLFTYDINEAVKNAASRAGDDDTLAAIEFHVGSEDHVHSEDGDFFRSLSEVASAIPATVQLSLRIFPGAKHQVWYAAWNAYHHVLWTGLRSAKDFIMAVPHTCMPA